MLTGLLSMPGWNLSWWEYVLVALALTHVTIAAITIFLHRSQAHRAVDLHPVASHFFRFWLWLTSGVVTKEWVAIHRKHHVKVETPEDPHSPKIYGIRSVLFGGYELYRKEAVNNATLETYGNGTPDDWLERNVYAKRHYLGIGSMLILDVLLFGPIGITIWAVQMVWIPFFAAGVINGLGHWWGYRSFETPDASTNLPGPHWSLLTAGEALHNNHHHIQNAARFSMKKGEIDPGYLYFSILKSLGLASERQDTAGA